MSRGRSRRHRRPCRRPRGTRRRACARAAPGRRRRRSSRPRPARPPAAGPAARPPAVCGSSRCIEHERVVPSQLRGSALRTASTRSSPGSALHQVRDHLGVGLGREAVARGREPRFELEVVLDDAVVHRPRSCPCSPVRVGVLLATAGRASPSACGRCRRARRAASRARLSSRLLELARARAGAELAVGHDRDARRVVAAVLEAAQALQMTGAASARRRIRRCRTWPGLSVPSAASPGPRAAPRPSRASTTCRARPSARRPAGTSSVMVLPAPMYAPSPIVTGATSVVSLPMNAPSPISGGVLV